MAVMGYVKPELVFGESTFRSAESTFYATRSLALGTMFSWALYKRSVSSLGILYLGRFVVEIGDLIATIGYSLTSTHPTVIVLFWLVVFIAPEMLALKWFYTQSKKS